MTLEMFKFGMLLTIIPFSVIFLFITVVWALVDLSFRELSGSRRIMWIIALLTLPVAGPIAYNYLVRRGTGCRKMADGGLCNAVN